MRERAVEKQLQIGGVGDAQKGGFCYGPLFSQLRTCAVAAAARQQSGTLYSCFKMIFATSSGGTTPPSYRQSGNRPYARTYRTARRGVQVGD